MKIRIFICGFFCLIAMSLNSSGQGIKIDDIAKIQFSTGGSFIEPFLRITEIVPEEDQWRCYQLAHYQNWPKPIRDSIRQFVKTVSINDLKRLIAYIDRPDTALDIKLFNISKKELYRGIDSLQASAKRSLAFDEKSHYKNPSHKNDSITANLTYGQKALFKNGINSKQLVDAASLKVLTPFELDDRYYYAIIFTHKDNHKDTVYSYENPYNTYHLPWRIKNKKSYDPGLTDLFESMNNNEKDVKGHRDVLNYMIDREIFNKSVAIHAYWEDYIRHNPVNYTLLSQTLSPVDISFDGKGGHLKSALLPANVLIIFGFGNDSLYTSYLNRNEKRLVDIYKKGSFLLDYLKEHPNDAGLTSVNISTPKVVDQIKPIYPDIVKYDQQQIAALSIWGDYYRNGNLQDAKNSLWLLLPDGKCILLRFNNKSINKKDKIFANFKSTPKGHQVCMVFDKDGKRIAGDESEIIIKTH